MNRTPNRAVTMLRQPSSNKSTGSTTPDNATQIWAALAPWYSKLRWHDERQAALVDRCYGKAGAPYLAMHALLDDRNRMQSVRPIDWIIRISDRWVDW